MDVKLNEFSIHTDHGSNSQFRQDVINGLQKSPKSLPSKYFYDSIGDELFQQIMAMPEYYLTKCELDIFKNKTSEIADVMINGGDSFDLIELGAGDAMKSTYLLKYLSDRKADFTYMPIDISGNILSVLQEQLNTKLPSLEITALEGEYFEMLDKATYISDRRKVVLFLGGNIGNMDVNEAQEFCKQLQERLNPGDMVLIGFDLKKNPQIILDAYNDKSGITAAFNLNLLSRINRGLNADFEISQFEHFQTYDPVNGACKSFLVSLKDQYVLIDDVEIYFEKDEFISVEISQKFSREQIHEFADISGFKIIAEVEDSKGWFVDSIWQIQ